MKIDIVKGLIAVAISALLAYACYEICDYDHLRDVISIGAFLSIVIPAVLAIGIFVEEKRGAVMLAVLSWVVLLVEVGSNFAFAFFDFPIAAYVVANGILLLLYLLIYHSIYNQSKKQLKKE